MASLLQRLGLSVARHRWVVIVVWLVALAGIGTAAATLSGPTSNSFAIPGAESTKALDVVGQKFPGLQADGATAQVVLQAPDGAAVTDQRYAAAVTSAVQAMNAVDGVASASNPLDPQQPVVSQDRTVALSTVTFSGAQGNIEEATLDAVEQAADGARDSGLTVALGGSAFQGVPEVFGPGEIGGVIVAFVVLMLTYGSLAAAGANLLTALVGVGIGAAGITALTGFVDLQSTTSILAIMLGLAVGIDYALFIFARFRSELREGASVEEAVGTATGTAGSAVVVAGLTVVIALAGLSVVGIPFLGQMGLAAAATVVVAVLVALTFVPAVLTGLGHRVLRRSHRPGVAGRHEDTSPAADSEKGFLAGWASVVTRRPALALLGGVLVLGVVAVPVASMQTALPDSSTAAPGSQERIAYDTIAEKFGPGLSAPLLLLVEGDVSKAADVAQQVQGTEGVAVVTPPQPSEDGTAALLTVIPTTGPHDDGTEELVTTLRDTDFGSGVEVRVTGATAVSIDVDDTVSSALPRYLGLVVGLALILLLLVFRSILVPVTATVGFLLSYGAALGATTAIFQWGWLAGLLGVAQAGPLMSLLPIIVVGILFGLAMDYQVFLVSRIHEAHAHGESPIEAVRHGFRRSAPVVVAAASIMAAVFGGFAGSSDPMIKSIAFALTAGVLFDAFVVRMVIIPAVLSLLGSSAWWIPAWLDRVLPHVDVEGAAIARDRREHGEQSEPTELTGPDAGDVPREDAVLEPSGTHA